MPFERIRTIENELETGQTQSRGRSIIHDVKTAQVPGNWEEPAENPETEPELENQPAPKNWFKKLFIFSLFFALIGGGIFAASMFLNPQNLSEKNVVLQIASRSVADGGESFPVTVTIVNKNKVPLEFLKLSLEYPLSPGGDISGLYQEKNIDTLAPGEVKDIPFSVSLYGSEGTIRNMVARLSYRVPGSVALFESISDTSINLRSSPVLFTIETPEEVFPNQEVAVNVSYASNLKNISPSSMLRMEYPAGFKFISAEPKPDIGNNTWKLGTLIPGAKSSIAIKGTLSGVLGEGKMFTGTFGSIGTNQVDFESIYASANREVQMKPSFLAVSLDASDASVAGDRYVLSAGKEHEMTLRFKNTLNNTISNAKIQVTLSGNIFNANKLRPRLGYYDSSTNTITWTADESSSLASIPAGGSGELSFSIADLSIVGGDGKIINNPNLNITVSVSGISENGQKLETQSIIKNDYTLSTAPNMVTTLLSTTGPIKNTGVFPPAVGKETTYTVGWKLSNTLNDVGDVSVSTTLPQWVKYTKNISPQSAAQFVTYNETTRTITWSPGKLAPGVGYTSNPLVVYFQISIKPSASQLDSAPVLTGPATFRGRDENTGAILNFQNGGLTTASSNDGNGNIVK